MARPKGVWQGWRGANVRATRCVLLIHGLPAPPRGHNAAVRTRNQSTDTQMHHSRVIVNECMMKHMPASALATATAYNPRDMHPRRALLTLNVGTEADCRNNTSAYDWRSKASHMPHRRRCRPLIAPYPAPAWGTRAEQQPRARLPCRSRLGCGRLPMPVSPRGRSRTTCSSSSRRTARRAHRTPRQERSQSCAHQPTNRHAQAELVYGAASAASAVATYVSILLLTARTAAVLATVFALRVE
jgi:hypothetical protein